MYAQNTLIKSVISLFVIAFISTNALAQISKERIEELNAQAIEENWPFKVGETSASNRPVEVLCGYAAGYDSNQGMLLAESGGANPIDADIDLPVRFDWRDYDVVPEPRAQGDCGSCYAFAATGIVESAVLIRSHLRPDYMDLSEQWIVSCCPLAWAGPSGCDEAGGFHREALDHIRKDEDYYLDYCGHNGAVLETDFPYSATDENCGCPYPHHYWIESRNNNPLSSVEDIKKAIYLYGPVATVVHAGYDVFSTFKGNGIFTECESGGLDHVVIFVGWDDDPPDPNYDGPGVWLLRNSWWAPDPNEANDPNEWGDGGYMRIPYDCPSLGYQTYYVTLGNDFYLPQPGLLSMTADIENGEPNVLPTDPNRDEITYTIHYGNPVTDANDPNYIGTLNNVIIVDYLPEEVEINLDIPDLNYSPEDRSYCWEIGTLEPNESKTLTLSATVNELAYPGYKIINGCIFNAPEISPVTAYIRTDVNNWWPPVIYVNHSAESGHKTGHSWADAYLGLQDALDRAVPDCGSQIWVAKGTYKPDGPLGQSNTIQLVSGIPVYGHFAGWETSLAQRNLNDPNSETILSGHFPQFNVYTVVTAADVNEATVLDGFTITTSVSSGVSITGSAAPTIAHCKVRGNTTGISLSGGAAVITGCEIADCRRSILCYPVRQFTGVIRCRQTAAFLSALCERQNHFWCRLQTWPQSRQL